MNKPASLTDSIEEDPGLVLTIMVGSCLHKWGVSPGEANTSLVTCWRCVQETGLNGPYAESVNECEGPFNGFEFLFFYFLFFSILFRRPHTVGQHENLVVK